MSVNRIKSAKILALSTIIQVCVCIGRFLNKKAKCYHELLKSQCNEDVAHKYVNIVYTKQARTASVLNCTLGQFKPLLCFVRSTIY